MKTVIYPNRKKYTNMGNGQHMVYLNEEIVENYVPENSPEGFEPITGYSYTGTEQDGGTLINAKEATYDELVSGLIRNKYSANAVEAIILNKDDGTTEHATEYADLQAYRLACKTQANLLLS